MKQPKNILITKYSGDKVPFDPAKLRHSLKKSGAKKSDIDEIVEAIEVGLYEGITTKEIYKEAFQMLKKKSKPSAAKYKLKKAILELGPSGFPFEQFVGRILQEQGFKTKIGVIVHGHCIKHEVDVIAEKEEHHYMVECKFHKEQRFRCDVKVPLYIQSRFKDVEKQWKKKKGHNSKFHQGWIVTNTRFTDDALAYGTCSGLNLISWDYPIKGGLKDMIDEAGLHPVTSLTTLTKSEIVRLLEKDIVLSKTLCQSPAILTAAGIDKSKHQLVLEEAEVLCNLNIEA